MKKHILADHFQDLSEQAFRSDRKRAHLNTHDTLDAEVQRLFIATEPDTYIRPHRHSESHKWEFFVVLDGALDLLIFDDEGSITERAQMSVSDVRAVEIPSGTWHTYVCRESGSIALEVKQGGYIPTSGDDFAPWAPAENSSPVTAYLEWLKKAPVGSRAPE